MASSIPKPWRAAELRSGGKIVRPRRTAGPRTPYDRPQSPSNSSPNPQNPNWLSRLIYSPTRMIATGAGKILSSVFTNEDSSSSSSSSSSSDSDSEEDTDDENDVSDTMKKKGTVDIVEHVRSGHQSIVEKSQTKRLIEQLLTQVTFSREECDRLTGIIKSRVTDRPVIGRNTEDQGQTEPQHRTIGSDHCSAAIMEAKKWLLEKKPGSCPNSELELGPCNLNSAMSPHAAEGEFGSPVDMAKLYMRTRPPWASPSASQIEYRSPSPTEIQLLKEETPRSTGYTSLTTSKMKRDSPASGSWNIMEEIRKVRSKATEEMLRTPSSKIDWSLFSLEKKSVVNSVVVDEAETSLRDKVHSSRKPVATSVNVSTVVSSSFAVPVTQVTQDLIQTETVLPSPPTVVSEQNQPWESIQTVKGISGRLSSGQTVKSSDNSKTVSQSDFDAANIDGLKGTNGILQLQPFSSPSEGNAEGLKIVLALNATPDSPSLKKYSTPKDLAGKSGSFAVNGFPTSGSSLSLGHEKEQNSRPPNENQNTVTSDHDGVLPSVTTGEVSEFFSEASLDVPVMHANDSNATGSQNSSSMHNEGLSLGVTTTNPKRRKTISAAEKQQGKKLTGYNRRGRGRGRGK